MCSKILGEAGKQEILQQMFRKIYISNRLLNRYFPQIEVGCPCNVAVVKRSKPDCCLQASPKN